MGYRVAGKTGTAHKKEHGGYAPDKYVSSFVGFAPASNPRLVIAVMIDEPTAGKYYGGAVAAPVFARVMEGALRMLGRAAGCADEADRTAAGGCRSEGKRLSVEAVDDILQRLRSPGRRNDSV